FTEPARTAGWSYDNSNKYIFASDGGSFNLNGSVNIPVISNINAYKLEVGGTYNIAVPNTDMSAVTIRAGVQYGGGYGQSKQLP
ncbi:BamA/TamA family outer membrane protein, partial [Francisella tularensis subsp. holarctica]|uniref:BamA/TamA family outer membrane protein n=1 Tax=Francisella tularensis TaxID=263 RepID=UPI002381CD2D